MPDVINGEAYAGSGLLWQTDFDSQTIRLIDTSDCGVVQTCSVPSGAPSENAFDGQYVYHYNFGTGLLYKIDPSDCTIPAQCNPPGDDLAEGLTFDGEFFWKGDSTTLFKISGPPSCSIISSCPNPAGDSADGLGVCGNFLIMLGYSGTLYQIDRGTCEVVSSCALNAGSDGNGLTTDGVSSPFVDQPGFIDVVNVDCGVSFEAPKFDPPSPCSQTLDAIAGQEVAFSIAASDLDVGDTVTLNATGVPGGASLTPPLPAAGNPVSTDFSWTPGAGDAGMHLVVFSATDLQANTTECEVTIDVVAPTNTPTATPTATPTNTPKLPDGSTCTGPDDCLSSNCVDEVCCDTPCDGGGEACDVVGREGICTQTKALAPAASRTGLVITVLILAAVGVFAVVRRGTA